MGSPAQAEGAVRGSFRERGCVWAPLLRLREQIGVSGGERGVWGLLARLREQIGVVSPAVPVFRVPCSVGLRLMGATKGLCRGVIPLGFMWGHPGGAPRKPLSHFFQNTTVYWGNKTQGVDVALLLRVLIL